MNRFLLSFFIITATILGFIFFKIVPFTFDPHFSEYSLEKQTTYIEGLIQQLGSTQAYEKLSYELKNGTYSEEDQHRHAHTFGGALYELAGVQGFSVCDDGFWYGCAHEFTGQALVESGVEVIETLSAVCQASDGLLSKNACQHGIGHGILAAHGYASQDRDAALETCAAHLPNSDPIYGCNGGVFMEYYDHTMLADNSRLELAGEENAFDLCKNIDPLFAEACAFRLAQWWFGSQLFIQKLDPFDGQVFLAERFCEKSAEYLNIESNTCLQGLGNMLGTYTSYDAEATMQWCLKLTGVDHVFECMKGAAYRLTDVLEDAEATNICEGLSAQEQVHACKEFVVSLLRD